MLTLEGYFVVTGARLEKTTRDPLGHLCAFDLTSQEKILNSYVSYLHAIMTSTERVDSSN